MTKIVFARHGETIGNVDPSFGDHETGFLTLKGMKQAELGSISLMREPFHIEHYYTSKMLRAMQTCSIFMQMMGENDYTKMNRQECLNERHHQTHEKKIEEVNQVLPTILKHTEPVLVVTHYFTMQAIFDILELNQPRERMWNGLKTVPHARPFIYDTETRELDVFNENRKDYGVAHG